MSAFYALCSRRVTLLKVTSWPVTMMLSLAQNVAPRVQCVSGSRREWLAASAMSSGVVMLNAREIHQRLAPRPW